MTTPPQNTSIGEIKRPAAGWLRTWRDAHGLTLAALAQRLKITAPAVRSFEQAEAEDRITLASLRRVAAAMECDLIYSLVPRTDASRRFAEHKSGTQRGALPTTARAPDPPGENDPAKKVTDLTWRTLHGGSQGPHVTY